MQSVIQLLFIVLKHCVNKLLSMTYKIKVGNIYFITCAMFIFVPVILHALVHPRITSGVRSAAAASAPKTMGVGASFLWGEG